MANTLDEKIEKLTKAIAELSDNMSEIGNGGALQSSNDEVRGAAEKNALRRLKMEEALLEKKEKQTEKEWRNFKKQQMYEETRIGKMEGWINDKKEIWGGVGRGVSELYSKTKEYAKKVWGEFKALVGEIDKAAVSAYRTMGMSVDTMVKLRQHAVATADAFRTAKDFNASSADLLNLQVSYAKELGRNLNLNSSELANMAAMRRLVGDEQAIKFTANFEKFGIDVNSASNEMVNLFNEASKSGLNFAKYSSMVADNLHLAQQYTFTKGIDGLKDMVKQSMAVRWNMQQTAAFAEKVSSVEGAITTSAQMSVLGGEFAQFANPMNMLYESLNDMEGLNDRLIKMFSQFATFNKKTNQIEVSAFDRMRIKSAAQAMGLDYGQVMDSVYGMGRAKVAEDQLRGSGLSEEYKTFFKNKAMIDRENGKAYINLMGKNGKIYQKYADSEFTKEDEENMDREMRTESQDIKSIAKSAQTIEEMLNGIKEQFYEKLRQWIEDNGGIEWVKEKIGQLAKAGLDTVEWIGNNIVPHLGKIAIGLGLLLTTTKLIIPLMKAITMSRISSRVGQMAYPYAGAMMPMHGGYGSAMMMAPGMGVAPLTVRSLTNYGPNGSRSMSIPNGALRSGYSFDAKSWRFRGPRGYVKPEQALNMQNVAQTRGMSSMAMGATSIGLGLASAGLGIGGEMLHTNGHHGWGAAANIASSTAAGASMGMMFGPWGAAIGAVGGLIYGGIKELVGHEERKEKERLNNERKELNVKFEERGVKLQGDYSNADMKKMLSGNIDENTRGLMAFYGDEGSIPRLYGKGGFLPEHKRTRGGFFWGPTHSQGGIKLNEEYEVEGEEAIIPAEQAMKFFEPTKSLIDGTFGQKYTYTSMLSEKPMGNIMKVSETNSSQIGVNRIDFSSLNMNMGGTLRLELMGNNKDIDARKLLDDPKFNRTIEGMIRENVTVLGSRDKRRALSRYDNPDINGRNVRWT